MSEVMATLTNQQINATAINIVDFVRRSLPPDQTHVNDAAEVLGLVIANISISNPYTNKYYFRTTFMDAVFVYAEYILINTAGNGTAKRKQVHNRVKNP